MHKGKCNMTRLGAAALCALCLTGGAALAAGEGGQNDPLITLSYLTQTVTPSILDQVDQKTVQRQQELTDALNRAIQNYSAQMNAALGTSGAGEQSAATYTVITLTAGQQLQMDIGCEVMLRIGTASCVSPDAPGLIDTTGGSSINSGGALAVNHLYMATIEGRGVTATSAVVKVLVRGGYSIV